MKGVILCRIMGDGGRIPIMRFDGSETAAVLREVEELLQAGICGLILES